jgi:flotillin
MAFIKANTSEYLVIGKKGKINNLGVAASAYIWPGWAYVRVPSVQQEAIFEMTQESQDGIPLRFKGIVIFRIVQPEISVKLFNFTNHSGLEEIKTLISHICLGELRAVVAHKTMKQCIEERKTTLMDSVKLALQQVVNDSEKAWGIQLDVVQVAQVFIVDNELRHQLEAEVRNEIKSKSDLSNLQAVEAVQIAKIGSERRVQQESLETEKQRVNLEREKLQLQREFEQEQIETNTPLRLLKIEKENEILQAEQEMRQIANKVKALEVENQMLTEKAKQDLRKEILPLEQAPIIAEAISHILQGANLSVYGDGAQVLGTFNQLVNLLTTRLEEINKNA